MPNPQQKADWTLGHQLIPDDLPDPVKPVEPPPAESVQYAWPFATDEERELIREWFAKATEVTLRSVKEKK